MGVFMIATASKQFLTFNLKTIGSTQLNTQLTIKKNTE